MPNYSSKTDSHIHRLFFILLLISTALSTNQAQNQQTIFANTITKEDLKKHLSILADDAMQGRETGTPGNDQAAKYISGQFALMGIKPLRSSGNYYQPVVLTWHNWKKHQLKIRNQSYKHFWDYYAFPQYNKNIPPTDIDQVTFLGYGIHSDTYSDYKKVPKGTLKDRAILIYRGEPKTDRGMYRISGTDTASVWSDSLLYKLRTAAEHGVAWVFIIDQDISSSIKIWRDQLIRAYLTFGEPEYEQLPNTVFISPAMAKNMLGKRYRKIEKRLRKINKKGKSKALKSKTHILTEQQIGRKTLRSQNVVAYIEGIDPRLNDEFVTITAHYDHLGMRGDHIFNGADDNASGTSAVIELAQAFKLAKNQGHGPKRSMLFMLMTGEEKGLLGSQFYTKKPLFPLDQTVVNINIDMIGRRDRQHQDDPNYIYVIGADRISSALHQINEAMNEKYTHLKLDYTYNAEDDPNRFYYRSDHYNFAKNGIPAVFYFNGTHKDYHRASDTMDKIEFDKMEKITRLIFHTAWQIANRPQRLQRDKLDISTSTPDQ